MLQVIILVIQLTFSNGYLQTYPLPTTDVFVPRPFPFEDVAPMGF